MFNRKLIIIFLLCALVSCANSSIIEEVVEEEKKDNSGEQKLLRKALFIDIVSNVSLGYFCENTDKYTTCLDVDVSECKTLVNKSMPLCSERILRIMPDLVTSREEKLTYAGRFGECMAIQIVNQAQQSISTVNKCFRELEDK